MATNNAVNTSLSGQSGTGSFAGTTNPLFSNPRANAIYDTNNLQILGLTATASAVNNMVLFNAATANDPGFSAFGSDTDVNIRFLTQGAGQIRILSAALTNPLSIFSGTGLQHTSRFNFANTNNIRDITFPDLSGTVAFTSTAVTQLAKQIFTSSNTYTPTTGMKYCIIECWGSGGGGGGAANSGGTGAIFGAGGGSAGYSRLLATAATIGASQAVTIAAGGAGGTAGANPGISGSSASVGSLCVSNGGAGGGASNAAGGAGGAAGTGDITGTGAVGISGFLSTVNTISVLLGQGAASAIGGGGNTRATQGTGNAATGFGAGGAGGLSSAAGGTAAGGAGSGGFVCITEYI